MEININKVKLSGRIVAPVEFSHEIKNEKFYKGFITVNRPSGTEDIIPFVISQKLIPDGLAECYITLNGELRTYNKTVDEKRKLMVMMHVHSIVENRVELYENEIELEGYVCKEPSFRITPTNKVLCDLMLAVNRNFNKTNYVPVICWNKDAEFAKTLLAGTKLKVIGKVQSREYIKNNQIHTVYEVSVNSGEIYTDALNAINGMTIEDFEPLEEVEL